MASILIRTMTEGDHGFYAPAWNKNGTLRPGPRASTSRSPSSHTTFAGRSVANAMSSAWAKTPPSLSWRCARRMACPAPRPPQFAAPAQPGNGRRSIASVTAAWLLWAREHKSPGTYDAYKRTSEEFHGFLAERGGTLVFFDQITEGLILDYKICLERKGYAEAYRWKLLNQLHGCLRRAKHFNWISTDDMPKKDDGRRYVEYSPEQAKTMLEKGCTEPGDWEFVALIAMAGIRRNEIVHVERDDFDFRTNEVTVRNKRKYDHKVKDRQERTIGIDPALMGRLRKYLEGLPEGQSLLFPAARGGVERHLERRTKRIAKAAGVPVPEKPNHAFRVSYATWLNRAGTDIETVRRLLGHYDIKTTQIYLRSLENQDPRLQAQVKAATAELGITRD